jgi:hypothetical protein
VNRIAAGADGVKTGQAACFIVHKQLFAAIVPLGGWDGPEEKKTGRQNVKYQSFYYLCTLK